MPLLNPTPAPPSSIPGRIPFLLYKESLPGEVNPGGAGHPYPDDRINRAMKWLLQSSGFDWDAAVFAGLFGPAINIRAMGARGDGIHDDTAAIQAAYDKAEATGIQLVYWPAGRWGVTKVRVRSHFPIITLAHMPVPGATPLRSQQSFIYPFADTDAMLTYESPTATRSDAGGGAIIGLNFVDPGNRARAIEVAVDLIDFPNGNIEHCNFHYLKGGAFRSRYWVQGRGLHNTARYCGASGRPAFQLGDGTGGGIYVTQGTRLLDSRVEVHHAAPYIQLVSGALSEANDVDGLIAESTGGDTAQTFVETDQPKTKIRGLTGNSNVGRHIEVKSNASDSKIAHVIGDGDSTPGLSRYLVSAPRCTVDDLTSRGAVSQTGADLEVTGAYCRVDGVALHTSGRLSVTGAFSKVIAPLITECQSTAANAIESASTVDIEGGSVVFASHSAMSGKPTAGTWRKLLMYNTAESANNAHVILSDDDQQTPSLNVTKFGVQTGVEGVDSSAGVAAAKVAALAAGAELFFPPGVYETDAIDWNGHYVLRGIPGSSVLRPRSGVTIGHNFRCSGVPIDVYGIIFDGVNAPTKIGVKVGGTSIAGGGVFFDRCLIQRFNGTGGIGLQVADAVDVTFDRSVIVNNFTNVKVLGTDVSLPTMVVFRDGIIGSSLDVCLDIQAGRAMCFERCDFESNAKQAAFVHPTTISAVNVPASGILFRECWFEDNWHGDGSQATQYAIEVDATGTTREVELTIRDCRFGQVGLAVKFNGNASSRLTIDGIDFQYVSQAANITVGGASTVCEIRRWSTPRNGAPATVITGFNSATLAGNVLVEEVLAGQQSYLGDITASGGFRHTIEGWYQDNVPGTQSATELTRAQGRWRAIRAGSVMGILLSLDASQAWTAGSMTAEVWKATINTTTGVRTETATGLTAVLDTTQRAFKATTQAKDLDAFAAGDEIFVKLTSASWTPTTADARVAVEIEC